MDWNRAQMFKSNLNNQLKHTQLIIVVRQRKLSFLFSKRIWKKKMRQKDGFYCQCAMGSDSCWTLSEVIYLPKMNLTQCPNLCTSRYGESDM